MAYTSCGFDGLAGRGTYPAIDDGGRRWAQIGGPALVQPWRAGGSGHALLIGQVPGDAAIYGLDLERWAQTTCDGLVAAGVEVLFRPHPLVVRRGQPAACPSGARLSQGTTLADDLAGAAVAVTFSSTTGVEAALAGVPVVTLDPGAMAWPVAGHHLHARLRPCRGGWVQRLAWTQWSRDEIERGEAWEALATCL